MLHLVIGRGQIGLALTGILKCESIDKGEHKETIFDVLHICIPYSKKFIHYVKEYIYQYQPKLVIIHSTVPIGTTEKLGDIAVHSPIRGIHPHLEEGIRTFVKYFGGKQAKIAANIFTNKLIQTKFCKNSRDTEAGKLWSTTAYGLNIILQKTIKEYCDKNRLNYKIVYEDFTETYNNGYSKLGMSNVIRPVLNHIEGKIGGHCIISNCKLLKNKIAKFILKENK